MTIKLVAEASPLDRDMAILMERVEALALDDAVLEATALRVIDFAFAHHETLPDGVIGDLLVLSRAAMIACGHGPDGPPALSVIGDGE